MGNNNMYITITRPNLLEFLNPEINKGTAVEYLAKMIKVPLSQTMTIGDGMNDIPMLQKVRYSVAVKNAPAAVEEQARYVVSSWEKDGVAEAIEWALRHNAKK